MAEENSKNTKDNDRLNRMSQRNKLHSTRYQIRFVFYSEISPLSYFKIVNYETHTKANQKLLLADSQHPDALVHCIFQ